MDGTLLIKGLTCYILHSLSPISSIINFCLKALFREVYNTMCLQPLVLTFLLMSMKEQCMYNNVLWHTLVINTSLK